jgi:hypothetical protein
MEITKYPKFDDIKLTDYELINGFATLGFLKYHRQDCVFITEVEWQESNNYELLDRLIQQGLSRGKIVCVVPWDEKIIGHNHLKLSQVLNKYNSDPVWLITQLNFEDQKIYRFQHHLECKIIEVPWWLLNDCLSYYATADRTINHKTGSINFLCMLGRYEPHKFNLAQALQSYSKFGLITVSDKRAYPEENLEFCQQHPNPPYKKISSTGYPKVGAQVQINNTWVSSNVENFLYIEKQYLDVPLMINPETTCGIFFNTEKSLWPLLLGKLMLIYGKPGVMRHMQRFYDVDFSSYADLSFDQATDDWSESGHKARLTMLVEKNQKLICNCDQIYKQLQPKLESARWTIGRNIYQYFVQQIEKIST